MNDNCVGVFKILNKLVGEIIKIKIKKFNTSLGKSFKPFFKRVGLKFMYKIKA